VSFAKDVSKPRPPWMRDALCLEYPDVTWFPSSNLCVDYDAPLAICDRCLVRAECLAYALECKIDYGVWGGMTAPDRRRVLAARQGRPIRRRPGRPARVRATLGS
jgi:WhiB family redox-sensing transcriptional regulator